MINGANFDSIQNFASSSPVPSPTGSGASQFALLSGLVQGTTYYFAFKSRDEKNNTSDISNLPSAWAPNRPTVVMNEIYPGGSAGADWVELYNRTGGTINTAYWTIYVDNTVNWTGGASDTLASGGASAKTLTNNIAATSPHTYELYTDRGVLVGRLVIPSMPTTDTVEFSYARLYDGDVYFEKDPTPTQGAVNA